jgi:hypothetical protein
MSPCIEFDGYRTPLGYGRKWHAGAMWLAHRLALLELYVPIAGMVVMHRCDNPPCVNPDHLTVGTVADNNADMDAKGRRRTRNVHIDKTHCSQGHPFTAENTYTTPQGWRRCRTCKATRWRHATQQIDAAPAAS